MEKDLRVLLPGGRFHNVPPTRSRIMRAIKGSGNKTTEWKFRLALVRAGIRNWNVRPDGVTGNPDFLFYKSSVIVFVDGCFWHACPICRKLPKTNIDFWEAKFDRNRAKDSRITQELENKGYTVLRFWEHDIKGNINGCIDMLLKIIETPM